MTATEYFNALSANIEPEYAIDQWYDNYFAGVYHVCGVGSPELS